MSAQPTSASSAFFSIRMVLGTAIVLGMVFLSLLVWYAINVLMLIFAGVLLAVLLRSLADWLSLYTRLSSTASLVAVLVSLVLVTAGLAWLIAPRVGVQVEQLLKTIPEAAHQIQSRLDLTTWGDGLGDVLDVEKLTQEAPRIVWRATGWLSTGIGAIFSFVIVLFIGIYLAVDPLLYTTGILRMIPPAYRPRSQEVLGALGFTLRWWLLGQLAAMTAIGLMTALGLWMLGVPLSLTLGLLAFVFDFVPYVGPIIAAIPAIILGLAEGPMMGLYVVLLYVAVQQIESMLIVPLVHKKTVMLPPVLTVVAQVLLSILAGPLGLLLATPLMAVTLVLVKMLYVEEVLGEKVETPEDTMSPEQFPPMPETHRVDEQESTAPHSPKGAVTPAEKCE